MNKPEGCHRCGCTMSKLFLLSEDYPTIEVCRNCAMDYHEHIKEFVDDIKRRNESGKG